MVMVVSALQNTDKEFILNGEFMVRTEKWVINVKGGLLDYSGSEENVERINSTRMIGEPIDVYVSEIMLQVVVTAAVVMVRMAVAVVVVVVVVVQLYHVSSSFLCGKL